MDKLKGCVMGCAKVYVVLLLVGALSILLGDWFAVAFIIAIPTYFIVFNIRVYLYFNGQEFASMKSRIIHARRSILVFHLCSIRPA